MTDLSSISTRKLKDELARREYLESIEGRLRKILASINDRDLEFIECLLKDDPDYLKQQISYSLSSRYDP